MATQLSINNLDFNSLENLAQGKRTRRPKASPPATEVVAKQAAPSEKGEQEKKSAARTARVLESIHARAAEAQQRQQTQIEQRVLQAVLPLWTDENRGVPNPFIRSGLFSVGNSEKREFLQDLEIPSLSNYRIRYSGSDLQQEDLTVLMSLFNMARERPMSEAIYFTGYKLVKDIGWRMHSDSYRRAQESIQRLKVTGLTISTRDSDTGYSGSLIRDYGWTEKDDKGKTKWMVRLEPKISALFMEDTTTFLEWQIRKDIGSKATLALWLHSYYTSHREPIPNSLEKLWELCRSKDTLSSFRRNIRNALARLVERGFLASFDMTKDMITVQKRTRPQLLRVK